MSRSKENSARSDFWNLTNTVAVIACVVAAGILGYLAIDIRANSAEISDVKAQVAGHAVLIPILNESIPVMREQLQIIDRRLIRLEVKLKTLPETEEVVEIAKVITYE